MSPKPRHETMQRLLLVAAGENLFGLRALANALDESDGTVGNWARRGVSLSGANKAQTRFGCNAAWILDGTSPQWINGQAPTPAQRVDKAMPTTIERQMADMPPSAIELGLFFDDATRGMSRGARMDAYIRAITVLKNQSE